MRRIAAHAATALVVIAVLVAPAAVAGEAAEPAAASPAGGEGPAPRPQYGLTLPSSTPRATTATTGRGRLPPYHATGESDRSRDYYRATWGVDKLRVVYTMSGNLIRFSFRVVQPRLAHPLGDHEATPQLYAPKAHAYLQVPTMEQVGPLRQLHTDKAGEEFWLLFSNKGNLVHKGDRVDVIIGKFHADGLVVE
jgi:hypothetical protein